MAKVYRIDLSEAERAALLDLVRKGSGSARKLRRAQILLLAANGKADAAIAEAVHAGVSTVERTRKRFVEEGLEAALVERPRPGGTPKLARCSRHSSSRWPRPSHPKGGCAGRCNCWPSARSS